nr:DUF523 domain-containing protein [uncultured Peptostreptococcus sp.]
MEEEKNTETNTKGKILVSACLLGIKCKYNGRDNKNNKVIEYLKGRDYIKICPESMGGLKSPRLPSEIEYGYDGRDVIEGRAKVFGQDGSDLTKEFLSGAKVCIELAKKYDVGLAILKESSPSCGGSKIYTGKFEDEKKAGQGVTASLFKMNGIRVLSEENI